jgi:hypothetical protein
LKKCCTPTQIGSPAWTLALAVSVIPVIAGDEVLDRRRVTQALGDRHGDDQADEPDRQ